LDPHEQIKGVPATKFETIGKTSQARESKFKSEKGLENIAGESKQTQKRAQTWALRVRTMPPAGEVGCKSEDDPAKSGDIECIFLQLNIEIPNAAMSPPPRQLFIRALQPPPSQEAQKKMISRSIVPLHLFTEKRKLKRGSKEGHQASPHDSWTVLGRPSFEF
jgi:hypothetical protein